MGYVFYPENYKDAESVLIKLYKENPRHPVFTEYRKTGVFEGFSFTNLGKKPSHCRCLYT